MMLRYVVMRDVRNQLPLSSNFASNTDSSRKRWIGMAWLSLHLHHHASRLQARLVGFHPTRRFRVQ